MTADQTGCLQQYLRQQGLYQGPITVSSLSGGLANRTYAVHGHNWEAVIRLPPDGPVAPRAHNMIREGQLLMELAPWYPLAPRPWAICDDMSVLGYPFYIMERRHGMVMVDRLPDPWTAHEAWAWSKQFIEALASLHRVDWTQTQLGNFGHPEHFLSRHVNNWTHRFMQTDTGALADVSDLVEWLNNHLPRETPIPTVIHNDYRWNNVLIDPGSHLITSVLDWEMATIGDPWFDLAGALTYWIEPSDPPELQEILPHVTTLAPFPSRQQLVQWYQEQTGNTVRNLIFYQVLNYVKLAAILAQLAKRADVSEPGSRGINFSCRAQVLIKYAKQLAIDNH